MPDLAVSASRAFEAEKDVLRILNQALGYSVSAVALGDMKGRLCYVNSAFLKLWGYSDSREVLGRRATTFWESPRTARNVVGQIMETGSWSGELVGKRKDGSRFRALVSAGVAAGADGRPLYLIGSFVDITEQAQAMDASRKCEFKRQVLVETSSDWIWEVDARGVYTYSSNRCRDLLGYERDQIVGRSVFSFMPPDEAERVRDVYSFHVQTRTPIKNLENVNIHSDGHEVILETSGVPVFDDCGVLQGFCGIDRDITERIRVHNELKRARDNLELRVEGRTRELEDAIRELVRSKARYQAIVEDQDELICRFTPNGTITFANQRYRDYFDRSGRDSSKACFKPLAPENKCEEVELRLSGLTPKEPVDAFEFKTILPGGLPNWQQWVVRAIFGSGAEPEEIQAVGRDITEQMLARQEADEARKEKEITRRRLEAVFSCMSDAIFTVDRNLVVVNVNEALHEVCSKADKIRPGACLSDIFENGELPPCLNFVRDVLDTEATVKGYSSECSCARKENQASMINASPLYDHGGEFSGAVIVVRDMTRLGDGPKKMNGICFYKGIVGGNRKMRDIFTVLDRLSDIDTTVLITGESGTGKEMIVEALHYGSTSITGPLVKVNCSALAETLLESELFGHVRGAFTGAITNKIGRFQAAEGGTIFLDEIGDLNPNVQLKLLRVLERKEFERVGDSTTCKADVRVVAATNSDLIEKVRQGVFRKDLYYRLRVMVINVPPLRERVDDISLLTDHFLNMFQCSYHKGINEVADEVMEVFTRYLWPGNVRELKHTIEHALILCDQGPISVQHLPPDLKRFAHHGATGEEALDSAGSERLRYLGALEQAHWNRTRAARLLGVSRTTLYRKMSQLGINT